MIESLQELLQSTFNREDLLGSTCQNVWIMAASVAPFSWNHVSGTNGMSKLPTHTIRIILQTTDRQGRSNDYVDGTDVFVIMDEVNRTVKFTWEDLWEEGPPLFHGGTVPDALRWLHELAKPFYAQLKDPFLTPEKRVTLNDHDEDYIDPAYEQRNESCNTNHLTDDEFDKFF